MLADLNRRHSLMSTCSSPPSVKRYPARALERHTTTPPEAIPTTFLAPSLQKRVVIKALTSSATPRDTSTRPAHQTACKTHSSNPVPDRSFSTTTTCVT
ncbi:hypothetical protein CBOM_07413 [Ceraceosorus bombacis]|uniref:Uncharacterized protein n=1 Tax=Ceraceosorus bombacis TaxID=401625 RepID=A0A0P1BB77_9BASI|nr:hypothetical protein CBOM_07413 [Ceraceosorus bombacis]